MTLVRKSYSNAGSRVELYEDVETGARYRRVVCGFAWPHQVRPGFVCVVAEDLKPDHSLKDNPRHLRVMDELESHDLEALHRGCHRFADEYGISHILGCDDNSLYEIWRQLDQRGDTIRLLRPLYLETLDLHVVSQLVMRATWKDVKKLHFGNSRLPSYLTALTPEEMEQRDLTFYPAVAALGYCLGELEFRRPRKRSQRWKRRNRNAMVI